MRNKTVLVTGGNRGIGLAIALAFAEEGANVAICGRDQSALDRAQRSIEKTGGKSCTVSADLFTLEGCERAVRAAVDGFGGLDVLVNNASTNVGGKLEHLSDEKLMERVMGKTLASMRCCRAALPHLRKAAGGRIICIGGTSARTPGATSLPSGLGNSSLTNFAKHFSNDVASSGITVNVVHPSFTKTDRYPQRQAARAEALGITPDEAQASFAAEFPIGRIVVPGGHCPVGVVFGVAAGISHYRASDSRGWGSDSRCRLLVAFSGARDQDSAHLPPVTYGVLAYRFAPVRDFFDRVREVHQILLDDGYVDGG